MKKVCVFTLYADKGASSQYRAYLFKDLLMEEFDLKWYHFWDNNYVTKYMHNRKKYLFLILFQYFTSAIKRWYQFTFVASKSDVVLIQKACIPKVKNTFLNRLLKNHVKIVFDVDDAVYLDEKDNSDDISRLADVVICGNEVLKSHYEQTGCHCVVLPTVEDTHRYEPYWGNTFSKKVVGWIGSASSVHNLELIVEPFNKIVERHPEVELHIISNDDQGYCNRIRNSKLIVWDKEEYVSNLSDITIGIMPLKDTAFNQGKCGFKLIQYLNMKKPVIGSGVGVNINIIDGNGIVANDEVEWESALENLLFSENKYNSCVSNIENKFLKEFHFDIIANQLLTILNEV